MIAQDLVRELAEEAVATIAPPQAELFALVAPAYLDDPGELLNAGPQRDEALGVGVGVAETLLIAAAVYVADAVVEQLISRATDAGLAQGRSRMGRLFGRKPRRDNITIPEGTLPLIAVKANALRQTALEKGLQVGLPQPKAQLLADAIVGDLLGREDRA
jgi:hypothetical protein